MGAVAQAHVQNTSFSACMQVNLKACMITRRHSFKNSQEKKHLWYSTKHNTDRRKPCLMWRSTPDQGDYLIIEQDKSGLTVKLSLLKDLV